MRADRTISISDEATSRRPPPQACRFAPVEQHQKKPEQLRRQQNGHGEREQRKARSASKRGHTGNRLNSGVKYSGRM